MNSTENTLGYESKPTVDMPAGDAKREQEEINLDHLQQLAEEKAAPVHATTIDPKQVKIDNEIAVHFSFENQLEVTDAEPGYKYYWCGTAARGFAVTYLLGIRIRNQHTGRNEPIWEIVKGDMPESPENKQVDGARRVGDVILLRARMDRYLMFRKWERQQRQQSQDPMTSAAGALAAEEAAHRRGARGARVTVNNPLMDPRYRRLAQQAAARGIAQHQLDQLIRDGKIPGFEAGSNTFTKTMR